MKLSLILPIYNEEQNIPSLLSTIQAVMKSNGYTYEIIAVNDGSRDGSFAVLKEHAAKNRFLKVLNFRMNAGQTAALRAGIDCATGDILIPMDGDLENDPRDIPLLLARLNEGYDVVSGWRKDRWHGRFFSRKFPSVIANSLISFGTGIRLHDWGCTLKAYRRDVIAGVPLYGEMHRFIPAYASWLGAKVTEVPVRYEPRRFGKSNYGISRTFRVLLDLLLIRFLFRYMDRPIHFFGGVGFGLLFLGALSGTAAVFLRIFMGLHFVQTPLPLLTALLLIMGVNIIMIGVLSEILMRTYYESRGQTPYKITDRINLD